MERCETYSFTISEGKECLQEPKEAGTGFVERPWTLVYRVHDNTHHHIELAPLQLDVLTKSLPAQ